MRWRGARRRALRAARRGSPGRQPSPRLKWPCSHRPHGTMRTALGVSSSHFDARRVGGPLGTDRADSPSHHAAE
eukprot:1370788-Prymnesium_polylepis.1